MSLLNQAAVEALCSATYLENYLDCMDNLPDDLQRCVSSLRELDCLSSGLYKFCSGQGHIRISSISQACDGGKLRKDTFVFVKTYARLMRNLQRSHHKSRSQPRPSQIDIWHDF